MVSLLGHVFWKKIRLTAPRGPLGLEFTQKWAAGTQPSWAERAAFWTPVASPQNSSQQTLRSLCFLPRARGAQAGRVLFSGWPVGQGPRESRAGLVWSTVIQNSPEDCLHSGNLLDISL